MMTDRLILAASYDEPPEGNGTRIFRGQTYECVAFQSHISRAGGTTVLAFWQSHCAECGAPFTLETGLFTKRFLPNRRCQRHKRPGRRVQP